MPGVEGDLMQTELEIGLEPCAPGWLGAHVAEPIEIRRGLLISHEGLVVAGGQFRDHVLWAVQPWLAVS